MYLSDKNSKNDIRCGISKIYTINTPQVESPWHRTNHPYIHHSKGNLQFIMRNMHLNPIVFLRLLKFLKYDGKTFTPVPNQ